MNNKEWAAFRQCCSTYKTWTEELQKQLPQLRGLQQTLVEQRAAASFTVESPLVYNRALDEVDKTACIKMILVADNPGRREQAAENRRYLVGPSGKLADNFFKNNPELGIDFRHNVIILNKTPVHTPRTAELKELAKLGGPQISMALDESQRFMAALLRDFHDALGAADIPVWIIGYSELGKKKLFTPFTEALEQAYPQGDPLRNNIYLFRHFSMNQFSADIKKKRREGEAVAETLKRTGSEYRERILGWKQAAAN